MFILLGCSFFLPLIVFVSWANFQMKRRRNRVQDPFTERRLRLAGESAAKEYIAHSEKLLEFVYWLIAPPAVACAALGFGKVHTWVEAIPLFLLVVIVKVVLAARLRGHVKRLRAYRLGAEGERVVGDTLARELLPKGYSIYHDFILNPGYEKKPFNIDHIVVGPSGVFAVETKARSKLRDRKRAEVSRSGESLDFGAFRDEKAIPQARRSAEQLAKFLGSCLPDGTTVEWCVVVPGWWSLGNPSETQVMNHRMLSNFIQRRRDSVLSEHDCRVIATMIEEANRIEPVDTD